MNIKPGLVTLVICALILGGGGGCSEWKGDEGIVNIRIAGEDGGSGGGRAITGSWTSSGPLSNYIYDIYFIKKATHLDAGTAYEHYNFYRKDIVGSIGNIKYGSTVSLSVVPGTWILVVNALNTPDKSVAYTGSQENCIIKPGKNGDILINISPNNIPYYLVD